MEVDSLTYVVSTEEPGFSTGAKPVFHADKSYLLLLPQGDIDQGNLTMKVGGGALRLHDVRIAMRRQARLARREPG
jgi:hypothetical protein